MATHIEELRDLAIRVDKILKEELKKSKIKHDMAEARIYDVKSVGVQGDERTYTYPAEITLMLDGKVVWKEKLTEKLSYRITNEIKEINRVLYVFASKKREIMSW